MNRFLPVLGLCLLLCGCPYDSAPSGPSQSLDTWLVGQWAAKDKSGRDYQAVVAPSSSDHYAITLTGKGKSPETYDAWISKVDGFSILVVKFTEGSSAGKYALFHHELIAPGTRPPGGIGATRIRLSELQLDPSAETLDPYHLRRDIRDALKAGTLLAAYDVAAVRKEEAKETKETPTSVDLAKPEVKSSTNSTSSPELLSTPGSVIWTKTGDVTLHGETF
jgi:hypothetical protein